MQQNQQIRGETTHCKLCDEEMSPGEGISFYLNAQKGFISACTPCVNALNGFLGATEALLSGGMDFAVCLADDDVPDFQEITIEFEPFKD